MIHTPAAVAVPLRTDENGVIRIGQSRVTLVTVINRYKAGDSVDVIHEGFSTVALSDIYAVIAYYLANQETIEAYLLEIEQQAQQTRGQWEDRYTPEQKAHTGVLRQKIEAKRDEKDI